MFSRHLYNILLLLLLLLLLYIIYYILFISPHDQEHHFMSHSLNPILLVGSTVLMKLRLFAMRPRFGELPRLWTKRKSQRYPRSALNFGGEITPFGSFWYGQIMWNPTFLGSLAAGLWPSGFLGNVRRSPRWRCARRAVKERWLKKLAVVEFLSIKNGLWWDMDGDRMENN